MKPNDLLRALVVALVAALTANPKNQAALDDARGQITDLKQQLADSNGKLALDETAIAAQGAPLSDEEQAHAIDLLNQVASAPVIAVPAPPAPPVADAPVASSAATDSASTAAGN